MKVVVTLSLNIDEEILEKHGINTREKKRQFVEENLGIDSYASDAVTLHVKNKELCDDEGHKESVFEGASILSSIITRMHVAPKVSFEDTIRAFD